MKPRGRRRVVTVTGRVGVRGRAGNGTSRPSTVLSLSRVGSGERTRLLSHCDPQ